MELFGERTRDMDLFAYAQIGMAEEYVKKHYGEVPRLRGIRFMKMEGPAKVDEGETDELWIAQTEVYNKYVGKDVIYIHTRCGNATGYWCADDEDTNYHSCGGEEWEKENPDTFLESVDVAFDSTYRDHYFKAIVDDEYEAIVKELVEARKKPE